MKKTTIIHTRIEDSDLKKIRKIAVKECCEIGTIIRKAVKLFITSYK